MFRRSVVSAALVALVPMFAAGAQKVETIGRGRISETQALVVGEQQIYEDTHVKRSGPRYGVIWLSPQIIDSVSARSKASGLKSAMSLFGWEFQKELLDNPQGAVPVTNLVLAVAGLDQGLVLPSGSWLVGMRTKDDFELGIGPNISPLGAALIVSAGMTFHSGKLNIPFDIAYVSSRYGSRASVTTGFNVMK